MTTILHKIDVECPPSKAYQALSEPSGLSNWWTKAETKDPSQSVTFAFGPEGDHRVEMKVENLTTDQQVRWQCIAGPWEETGNFIFDLEPISRGTAIRFTHEGWPETDDFFMHCNSKWGFFLTVSLKSYLETGNGQPHPADPDI